MKLKKLDIINAGLRDPDSEDLSKSSNSSTMRDRATKGDFIGFDSALPMTMPNTDKKELFRDVQRGLGINIKEERCISMKKKCNKKKDEENPSPMWKSFREWFYLQECDKNDKKIRRIKEKDFIDFMGSIISQVKDY